MLVNVANFGGPNSNGYEVIQLSSMGGRGGGPQMSLQVWIRLRTHTFRKEEGI